MKYVISIFLLVVLFTASIVAQQDKPRDDRTTIVIQQDQPEKQNYYSIRAGVWFPKDWEKGFKFNDVSINEAEGDIDQSQALGLDFHYRRNLGRPMYVDLAVSGWYSSYTYKLRSTSVANAEDILNADSWVVIVPVTLGLSVAPLPDNPFQPYAMLGGGAYFGLTGRSLKISERNELNDDDSHIRFGWYFGLGLDVFLSPEFGISAAAKYQNLEFEEELFTGQKDFTGVQAQLGIVLKM
ncbi:MAG: porin family protein [Bacteroidia bacterium]|nr:porin family protein [Bacteroidia bacterium]